MTNKTIIAMLLFATVLFGSCDNSSQVYGNQLKEEKKTIKNYIARNHINIISEEPADGIWGEKDYLRIPGQENLYFHLVSRGDTTKSKLESGSTVLFRYRKYKLTPDADTISYMNTNDSPEPIEYKYTGNNSSSVCAGWIYVLPYMKYNNSMCKIICPSKLGFNSDINTVTPYGYDLRIMIR